MNKVNISCAVTGAIHTPSMSPYLPASTSPHDIGHRDARPPWRAELAL